MKAIELKFLLKLLGQPNYRALLSKLNPGEKTKAADRAKICRDLASRELIDYSREITKFKIEPAGKALLKQEIEELPLTEAQLLVLTACEKAAISPTSLKKLPAEERQPIIQELQAKGFIKAEKEQIKEVWLTDRGSEFLRDECSPGGTSTISLNLLKNYLDFLRKSTSLTRTSVHQQPEKIEPPVASNKPANKPDDDEVLDLIEGLDQELKTENYLPIFYVREKLQPPFSRDELDQVLYRLQSTEKLELSSLVETVHYTPEQIQAGIPQESGGPLFFLQII